MSEPADHEDYKALKDRTVRRFHERFGKEPEIPAQAPGRVNLIGEHTDYNDGFVLPIAVDRRTVIAAAGNGFDRVRLFASGAEAPDAEIPLDRPLAPGEPRWANYVRGVLAQFVEAGHAVPGFDAAIASSVPMGAGLSSSAALEVAAATAVERLTGLDPGPMRTARWCQRAEHDFAGLPCGIMDQMASAFGQEDRALRIDCRSLHVSPVALEDPELAVLVADSRVRHELADSEYPRRREQCERAVAFFRRHDPEVRALRDVTPQMLEQHGAEMDPTLLARARHVVGENERVLRFAEALERGDRETAGRLMDESHRSLRDGYEVSCRELDLLVSLAGEIEGVFGSRMTGGGFGGCTVTLVRPSAVEALRDHLERSYREATGREPRCFRVRPAAGANVEQL